MKILFVSYPMLEVSDVSCGGAEQMLWVLERELAQRGHRTTVAACDGSRVSGDLIATGEAPTAPDAFEMRAAVHCRAVIAAAHAGDFDLIHDKSGFFWEHADEIEVPVLATLHLPRSFYGRKLFQGIAENVFFNCVSSSQAESFRDLPRILGVVPNGIALERFRFAAKKGDYVVWLGRICPEKAPHLAVDAAESAGLRLVMIGKVYPFSWHQRYFDQELRPRLERAADRVRWLKRPSFDEKVHLLSEARALLAPTLAPETSSLVAMEAMACGTPVIAFPQGALPQIVQQGVTGFVVSDVQQMALALSNADHLCPEDIRTVAEQRFSAKAMADGYEQIYFEISERMNRAANLAA
jgi:glycosyltransferase involved in cell wall biosynthesis